MKIKDKPKQLYQLCLKSTGEPSLRVLAIHLFTEDEAARINQDVLKHAAVEWKAVPEDDERVSQQARDSLTRSAKRRR